MPQVETTPISRRSMTIFFLVDTSGSMSGAKIGAVNAAIEEVTPELQSIAEDNIESDLKVAVLKFSNGVEWLYDSGAIEVENFVWQGIPGELRGVTDLGHAFRELNDKLSRGEFMQQASGSFEPAIILLTDGEPTDDWKSGLDKLKENSWFKHSIRIAVAAGDDANQEVLKEFTGNVEAVFEVHKAKELRDLIKLIAVTSSMIGSKSKDVEDKETEPKTKSGKIIEEINKEIDNKESEPAGSEEEEDWENEDF